MKIEREQFIALAVVVFIGFFLFVHALDSVNAKARKTARSLAILAETFGIVICTCGDISQHKKGRDCR